MEQILKIIGDKILEEGVDFDNGYLLRYASEKGLNDLLVKLIELGADVNGNVLDCYPLEEAIENDHYETAKILIGNGADVNCGSGFPLIYSAAGWFDMVKLLVESGANVNIHDSMPLIEAAQKGNLDIVKYLMEHGADPNPTHEQIFSACRIPIIEAASEGHLDVVKYLVEHGVNPKIVQWEKEADCHFQKMTALIAAAKNNHFEVVKYLVETCHCNPNTLIHNDHHHARDEIPLLYAVSHGNLEMVKFLVESGAAIDLETYYLDRDLADDYPTANLCSGIKGGWIVYWSMYQDNIEILKYFIEKRFKTSEENCRIYLENAVADNRDDAVRCLVKYYLEAGLKFSAQRSLAIAIAKKKFMIAKLLVDSGAKVSDLDPRSCNGLNQELIDEFNQTVNYVPVRKTTNIECGISQTLIEPGEEYYICSGNESHIYTKTLMDSWQGERKCFLCMKPLSRTVYSNENEN